jgi:hypothetical protein
MNIFFFERWLLDRYTLFRFNVDLFFLQLNFLGNIVKSQFFILLFDLKRILVNDLLASYLLGLDMFSNSLAKLLKSKIFYRGKESGKVTVLLFEIMKKKKNKIFLDEFFFLMSKGLELKKRFFNNIFHSANDFGLRVPSRRFNFLFRGKYNLYLGRIYLYLRFQFNLIFFLKRLIYLISSFIQFMFEDFLFIKKKNYFF